MKKLCATGALALGVALLAQQQASAWVHCKFGAGVNIDYQTGGNNWLWGVFKNGQPPGAPDCVNCASVSRNYQYGAPPCCGQGGYGPGYGHGFGPDGPPMMAPYGQGYGPGPAGPVPPAPNGPLPAGADSQVYWFNAPTYSNVNFQPDYYQTGGYFMPVSGYNR
jgi:hypothetical protein